MTNPLWVWLVETGHGPYPVSEHFGGPPSAEAGPGWTNERFGQSTTVLPDGRSVLIGGEHEDYYDPDFYIYNDVIVRDPRGAVEIFGYDETTLPPTDFHTATLVGDRVLVVGNLGYRDRRISGSTQVLELDTATWHVRRLETTGQGPGWIHGHDVVVTDDGGLRLTGGHVWIEDGIEEGIDDGSAPGALIGNGDDWELDRNHRWHRLTDRGWQHWRIERADRKPSALWQLRTASLAAGRIAVTTGALARLYDLPVPHVRLPAAGPQDFDIVRVSVDHTDVRLVEDMGGLTVTIQGGVAGEAVDAVIGHLRNELQNLDNEPHTARRIC